MGVADTGRTSVRRATGRPLLPNPAASALHSKICYSSRVSDKRDVLRDVMLNTGTSQSQLARLSGGWQSSISQFLSGPVHWRDDQRPRLLGCMGQTRRAAPPPVA